MSDHPPPQPPQPGQPGQHPYAHHWPAYVPPPPKPERPLRSALVWTAVFSLLGVLLMVIAVGLLALALYALVWVLVTAMSGATWDFWGSLADASWGGVIVPVVMIVVAASLVAFLLCALVLLALRRAESVRRWAAPLQGLAACGITYLGGSAVVGVLAQIASMISGNG